MDMLNIFDNIDLENQDNRIDRYLKRQMTEEEETAFEQDLKTDKDLRSRARFVAQTIKAMKAAEEEEGMMDIGTQSGYRTAAKNPFATKKKK